MTTEDNAPDLEMNCSWSYPLSWYKTVLWYRQKEGRSLKTIWRAEGTNDASINRPEASGRIEPKSASDFKNSHLLVMRNPTYDDMGNYFCRMYIDEDFYESNHKMITANGKYFHSKEQIISYMNDITYVCDISCINDISYVCGISYISDTSSVGDISYSTSRELVPLCP